MENKKTKVIFRPGVAVDIAAISLFIENKGYPETAIRFTKRLYSFGESLANFPEKYAICRKKSWAVLNMRCAVFSKNYIFIYKLIDNELVVFNIVHARSISL